MSIHIKQYNREKDFERVATDPDFRRMGLGMASVLESLRRAAELGAEVAWVGSGQEFYKCCVNLGSTGIFFSSSKTPDLCAKPKREELLVV
jgi:GNAT superfamily N-acetyltransferase